MGLGLGLGLGLVEPRPVRPASLGADAAQPRGAGAVAWPGLAEAGGMAWRTRRLPQAQPRGMGPAQGHLTSVLTHLLTH